MGMQAEIQIKNIAKASKGLSDIKNINLDIHSGEIIGFIGPDGSGKTLLMNLLTTYTTPDNGSILFNSKNIYNNTEEYKQNIGYLPRTNPLFENMTVSDFLKLMAKFSKVPQYLLPTRVIDTIRTCQLDSVKNSIIRTLSKGAKRRVGIGHTIIHNPPLLLLDQPTAELDPNQARNIRNLIKSISKERTIIIYSQSLDDIIELCSRIIYIKKGEIVADINVKELLQHSEENTIYKVQIAPIPQIKAIEELECIEGVEKAEIYSEYIYLHCHKDVKIQEQLFHLCGINGWYINCLTPIEATIEELLKRQLIN